MYQELPFGDIATLYVTDADDIVGDVDPFYAHLKVSYDEEGNVKFGRAICNNIPCDMCIIQDTCKSGQHTTHAIADYARNEMPELFI